MMSTLHKWGRVYQKILNLPFSNTTCCFLSLNKNILSYQSWASRIILRPIHTGVTSFEKLFIEWENDYAHKVMETMGNKYSLIKYHDKISDDVKVVCSPEKCTSMIDPGEWEDQSIGTIIKTFSNLSDCAYKQKMNLSSEKFDNFVDILTDSLMSMTVGELEEVFINLTKWPETKSVRSRNFIEVWTALDHVLCSRLLDFDMKTLMKFSDHIYHLHLSKLFDYTHKFTLRCVRKYRQLTPQELVQTLFYVGACRKAPPDMIKFEILLNTYYEQLTVDEIAIICMGFFKSKTIFRSQDLLEKLMQSVKNEAETIHEVGLCAILKMIKYSLRQTTPTLREMLNSLTPQIPRLSILCCTHIALVGTTVLEFHKESLDAIAKKCIQTPSSRLKDLERLVFSCALYTYNPATDVSIYDVVIQELRSSAREEEILNHSSCFVNCLSYLGIMNIYPLDLIQKCFQSHSISIASTYKESQYGKSIFSLNNSVLIECKDYNGNLLDKKVTQRLANQHTEYMPDVTLPYKLSLCDQSIVDIVAKLEKIRGGKEYVATAHLLPHFALGDIVVCNDLNGKPMEISKYFTKNNFGPIQYAPTQDCKWFAISVTPKPVSVGYQHGPRVMKERQLKLLGYIPILIYSMIWTTIKSEADKNRYLTDALKAAESQPN